MYIDTIPSNVHFGMKINMVMNPNRCHNALPVDWDPFYYLKIGDTLTDWEGLIDSGVRLTDWQHSPVQTIVGKNKPAKNVQPDVNFSMFGRPVIKSTAEHCNMKGDDCWTIRVHPDILGISATTGYTTGGQELIIKGHGLIGKTSTTVTVDGVTCTVKMEKSTDERLVCETNFKNTASVTVSQPGSPGITYSFVNPVDINVTPDWGNYGTFPK
jgi:hypothetical protein